MNKTSKDKYSLKGNRNTFFNRKIDFIISDFSVSASGVLLQAWNGRIFLLMSAFLPQKAEWLSSPDFCRKEAKDHLYKSHLPSVEMGMPVASDNSCNDILFSESLKSFSLSGMVSFVCIVYSFALNIQIDYHDILQLETSEWTPEIQLKN